MNLSGLKLSWRTHSKNPLFTAINILGLAVAMTVVILIATYVRYELSFDAAWENAERIYRVTGTWITDSGEEITSPSTVGALRAGLEQNIPGVESVVRLVDWGWLTALSTAKASTPVLIPMADSTLFDVFSLRFLKGDPSTSLKDNFSIIINESSAKKFFGNENPIGKHIETDQDTFYTVTGVFEDITSPTHLKKYDMFNGMPLKWVDEDWGLECLNTYVKLQEGIEPLLLQSALDSLVKPHIKEFFTQKRASFQLNLQAVRDIHLYSTLSNKFSSCEENTTPAIENIRLFLGVGLLILIIACLNFINLSTARSAGRARQVGIAKVAGAARGMLFRVYMFESIALTIVAMAFALLVSVLIMPRFAEMLNINPDLIRFYDPVNAAGLVLLTIIVGILAGFLSSSIPVRFPPDTGA